MNATFMNSDNGKALYSLILLLNLSDKMDLKKE